MNIEEMIPPCERNFVGTGEFLAVGNQFFKLYVHLCNLRPQDRVLDLGCGIGRMAVPLVQYLNESGSYEGLDIVKDGIDWCSEKITPHFPNFRFQLADVHNKYYHPTGKYQPWEYRFPYPAKSFDFVILTSVFTHMFKRDMENYMREIARVLKVGGRCFITYFLMNPNAAALIETSKTIPGFQWNFQHRIDGCWSTDLETPEKAIAHDEDYVLKLYRRCGLSVDRIYSGFWPHRPHYFNYQDIVVATKTWSGSLTGMLTRSAESLGLGKDKPFRHRPHMRVPA